MEVSAKRLECGTAACEEVQITTRGDLQPDLPLFLTGIANSLQE